MTESKDLVDDFDDTEPARDPVCFACSFVDRADSTLDLVKDEPLDFADSGLDVLMTSKSSESVADPDSDESGSSIHFRAAWSSSSDEDSSVLVSDDSLFELDVLSVLEPSFDVSEYLSSIAVKHGCYQYVLVMGT